jgi:hypothetical protein
VVAHKSTTFLFLSFGGIWIYFTKINKNNQYFMENYTFNRHKHNYAIWTAARAIQRGFQGSETTNIKKIIENSELQKFANDSLDYSSDEYDKLHSRCSLQLIKAFAKLESNVGTNNNLSYGRVAKIIAIYLKTCVIFCSNGQCNKSKVIHPPVDNILLKQMSNIYALKDLKNIKWTQLNEKGYWNLVSLMKKHFGYLDWRLEEYWIPEG